MSQCLSVPGASLATPLSAEECFDLGKVAYSEADYHHTALWMKQALRTLQSEEQSQSLDWPEHHAGTLDQTTVLDYLSYSVYQQGAVERALHYTRRLLELGVKSKSL